MHAKTAKIKILSTIEGLTIFSILVTEYIPTRISTTTLQTSFTSLENPGDWFHHLGESIA